VKIPSSGGADGREVCPRLLIIAQLPPPVHGAAVINQMVASSPQIWSAFRVDILPISMNQDLDEVRTFSLVKIGRSVLLYAMTLWRVLNRKRPNIAYLTLSPSGFAFLRDAGLVALLRLFRIQHVFHLHSRGIEATRGRGLYWEMLCRFVFARAKVITLSKRLCSDISEVVPVDRVTIVPNGVEDLIGDEAFTSLCFSRLERPVPTILFLSNMLESKGPLLLLDALAPLARRGLVFRALFSGSWRGSLTATNFAARTNELGLDGFVRHLGPTFGLEKDSVFRTADLFVFPTSYDKECLPLVVLEAFSYGLPVIASNIAALPDVVEDGRTGYLVPPNDPVALSKRVETLVLDSELRHRLGDEARRRFKQLYTKQIFLSNLTATLVAFHRQTCK
jgi:glycosyltransferase involved in cell wall biosynthesis